MGIARFLIEVRLPFRLDLAVWALRRRPHNTIDVWDGITYTRTLGVEGCPVQLAVRQVEAADPERACLGVEVRRPGEATSAAGVAEARRVIERMLGVHVDLAGFYELATGEERLAALAKSRWPYGGLVYFHLLLDGLARAGHLEHIAAEGLAQGSTTSHSVFAGAPARRLPAGARPAAGTCSHEDRGLRHGSHRRGAGAQVGARGLLGGTQHRGAALRGSGGHPPEQLAHLGRSRG